MNFSPPISAGDRVGMTVCRWLVDDEGLYGTDPERAMENYKVPFIGGFGHGHFFNVVPKNY